MKIAVIDMGTNTFQLLVGSMRQGRLHTELEEERFVRLGKGGISQGRILPEARQRAIEALQYYSGRARELGADRLLAVATSALRSAANAAEVLQEIEQHTGLQVQVIGGEQEALYIYEGVKTDTDLQGETALVMDIGGGSIEFIVCDERQVFWKRSFEVGAQRLLDRFVQEDPVTLLQTKALCTYLDEELSPLWEAMQCHRPTRFVGSAGTFDTLRQIWRARSGQEVRQLDAADFEQLYAEFVGQPREARLQIAGLQPERVDMIVPAAIALRHVLLRSGCKAIGISRGSLKEGVLAQEAARLGAL